MTDKLPPNLLALFAPRPPLRWVPPPDVAPEKRRTMPLSGVAAFLPALAAYRDQDNYMATESWLQMRDRKKLEKKMETEKLLTEGPRQYKPHEDPNIRGDPFKTLVVARLSYEANEQDLEREFGRYGPIERIRLIRDTHAHEKPNKKPKPHRGYAFVVFEREKDMRAALEHCENLRIKDRKVKVDVERGRTVKGWKPRRLGGGLGGRGYTKAPPARPLGPGGFGPPGGGFRGGFRGGFDGGRGGGRGGFGGGFRGGRGGGFRSGGDFGGPRGGGRDRDQNGFGAPNNAPSGPGFGRDRGGYGGGRDFSSGGYESRGGGRSYDDRSGGGGGGGYRDREPRRTGSNMEPIRPRENGGYRGSGAGGDRDRDRDGGGHRDRDRDYDRPPRDDDTRKRQYDGGYEDPRKLRRY